MGESLWVFLDQTQPMTWDNRWAAIRPFHSVYLYSLPGARPYHRAPIGYTMAAEYCRLSLASFQVPQITQTGSFSLNQMIYTRLHFPIRFIAFLWWQIVPPLHPCPSQPSKRSHQSQSSTCYRCTPRHSTAGHTVSPGQCYNEQKSAYLLMSENITIDLAFFALDQLDIRLHTLLCIRLCEQVGNVGIRVQAAQLQFTLSDPAIPGTGRLLRNRLTVMNCQTKPNLPSCHT